MNEVSLQTAALLITLAIQDASEEAAGIPRGSAPPQELDPIVCNAIYTALYAYHHDTPKCRAYLDQQMQRFLHQEKAPAPVLGAGLDQPVSLAEAREWADSEPARFRDWVLWLLGATPADRKASPGIDGHVTTQSGTQTGRTVVAVKARRTSVAHVRALQAAMTREGATSGVLVCLEAPSPSMRAEALAAGLVTFAGREHPRLQLLSVEELIQDSYRRHTL
jgi:hypothetical protein